MSDRKPTAHWIPWKTPLTMGERVVLLAGLLCTALFLSIALYGELQTWPTFAVDTFRELAIFAFSITIFDNFKDIYLRREIEAEKEQLLDEATGRISTMLNNKNQLASNGIEDALIPFDARALRNIISELSPGDCLYCHDGSIPDFEDLKDLICQRAIDGVRFRFMFLAPYCMNAKRRALELEKSAAEYSSRCKEFGDSIETIRKRIRQSSQGANDNSNDIINRVQIRYFRSLLSIPFYLLEKGVNGTPASDLPKETAVDHLPTKAWTGYYLNKSSSSFIFIQWRRQADATLSSKIESQSSDMVLSLKRYWNFKWNESYIEFLESDLWLGEWNYECRDEVVSTEGSVYMGSCQVSEKSGRLNAVTKRNQTCIGAGQCTPIFINWTNEEDDGDIIHKYRNGKDNILFLSLSYRPEQPGTASRSGGNNLKPTDQKKDNSRIKAFVKLKAVKGNGSEEDNIIDENTIRDGNYHLKGEYYIIFPDDSMRRNDIFPSTYGEIILRRPNHQSISKARQSGKPKTSSR